VTNLPYLTASCAKFLRTVYPKGGTSIMLLNWVYALMEKIALDCPGSKLCPKILTDSIKCIVKADLNSLLRGLNRAKSGT